MVGTLHIPQNSSLAEWYKILVADTLPIEWSPVGAGAQWIESMREVGHEIVD